MIVTFLTQCSPSFSVSSIFTPPSDTHTWDSPTDRHASAGSIHHWHSTQIQLLYCYQKVPNNSISSWSCIDWSIQLENSLVLFHPVHTHIYKHSQSACRVLGFASAGKQIAAVSALQETSFNQKRCQIIHTVRPWTWRCTWCVLFVCLINRDRDVVFENMHSLKYLQFHIPPAYQARFWDCWLCPVLFRLDFMKFSEAIEEEY